MHADELSGGVYLPAELLQGYFAKAMALLVRSKDCQKEMTEYFFGKKGKPISFFLEDDFKRSTHLLKKTATSKLPFGFSFPMRPLPVFKSRIMKDINDAIVIESGQVKMRQLSFDITSITEKGAKRFINFLKCVPYIGETVNEVRSRKTFSSRYTFRPYPLAVQLWIESEKAITVPEDLRDFLKGSMRYHSEEEWRTSIVLSAIAVESVLADLYEEEHKTYAPNVPLGDLYYKVKDKVKFPPEVMKAIEMVNEARISAVHRSRFPVSDREATNALYGSTTFIMWYSANY